MKECDRNRSRLTMRDEWRLTWAKFIAAGGAEAAGQRLGYFELCQDKLDKAAAEKAAAGDG